MHEYLYATDKSGKYVKIEERKKLLREIRQHSYEHGDAHLAVAAVYCFLVTRNDELRIVQRGDKPENPYMWDKTAGGHVVADGDYGESELRRLFDTNLAKELGEELGVKSVVVARDAIEYCNLLTRLLQLDSGHRTANA